MYQSCKTCGELFEIEIDVCPYCGSSLFNNGSSSSDQMGLNSKAIQEYSDKLKKEKNDAKRRKVLVSYLFAGTIVLVALFLILGYWVYTIVIGLALFFIVAIVSVIKEYPLWIKEKRRKENKHSKKYFSSAFTCPICGSDNICSISDDVLNLKLECNVCGYIW